MTRKITYLDNAATTFPKPEVVYQAQDEYSRLAANPGRGAHKLAMESARRLFEARNSVAALLGIKNVERLVFTPGCTYSINMALKGLGLKADDVVMVGALEHNAVMRPLRQLEQEVGIKVAFLPYAAKGVVDLHSFIEGMLKVHPRLVIVSEGSNVTGETIDIRSIAAICGAHKVPLMIDAAQTAGRSKLSIEELGIAIWCASGHKSMFGVPGCGLLYVAPNVQLHPLVAGGTGSRSDEFDMPDQFPDHLEPGTLAGPAIAALGAAARWIMETGVDNIIQHEMVLTRQFLDWTTQWQVVRIYGNRSSGGTAVVSFDVPGVACDRVAQILDDEFGIAVRTGLHCAPSAHGTLGTMETGLVRVSFSCFNTAEDVALLCEALQSIATRRDAGELHAGVS